MSVNFKLRTSVLMCCGLIVVLITLTIMIDTIIFYIGAVMGAEVVMTVLLALSTMSDCHLSI